MELEITFEERFVKETKEEFETVFNKYRPKLIWYLMTYAKDKTLSEELADKTFTKSIDEFDKYDGERGKYSTWLFTIGYRLMLQHFKDTNRLESLEEDINGIKKSDLLVADTTDPYIYENKLKRKTDLIKKTIPQLPINYATVLTMREIDGQSYDTIAKFLDINLNTVKSRILQGRALLRKACKTEFDLIDKSY